MVFINLLSLGSCSLVATSHPVFASVLRGDNVGLEVGHYKVAYIELPGFNLDIEQRM